MKKIILSGGGTGGHIYPAVAVAEALKRKWGDDVELLFVGAEGKMEMEKVPALGYRIEGLPVAGLQRRLTLSNLALPFKVVSSVRRARRIIKEFGADMVVGFGGYASAPVLWAAQRLGVPTLIQEQNSYAGLTNKILAKRAKRICVSYDNMERFFPADRIVLTGNPLRGRFSAEGVDRAEALAYYGFSADMPTIFVVGGSLGTRTQNEMMKHWIASLNGVAPVQVVWQTGKFYEREMVEFLKAHPTKNIWQGAFIDRMDYAYAAADVVISRSGACTVSELCLVAKPTIFIPSPNVAEDHQTKNAMALVEKGAAEIIPDSEAVERGMAEAVALAKDEKRLESLRRNIAKLAIGDSAERVVREIESVLNKMLALGMERETKKIYFLGIGGIGMSAIARYFLHEGCLVAGYDRTATPLTRALEAEGAAIHYEDDVELIPRAMRSAEDTLVVLTPAIPADHKEWAWFREQGFRIEKRSQMLGHLSEGKMVMAVAGTHGKTTTSTLAAWLNSAAAGEGSAFLGGISTNFSSNLVLGEGRRLVVEADEYDRSFLRLWPDVAVITATDADHLDIYGTAEAMVEAFEQFASQIKEGGSLILKQGVAFHFDTKGRNLYRYSCDAGGDFHAENIRLIEGGHYRYDIVLPDGRIEDCELGILGKVHIENSVAAVAMLWCAAKREGKALDSEAVRRALRDFAGVKRRMEVYINTPKQVYIDDYAHHPEELRATIESLRGVFPGRKLTAIFQPHLYTRTRDHYRGFAEVLSLCDEVVMVPIYPAREEPIEGVCSEMIGQLLTVDWQLAEREELVALLEKMSTDVVVTFGAGNIDVVCSAVAELLKKRA